MEITVNDILYVVLTMLAPMALRFIWQLVSAKIADSKYAAAINDIYTAVDFVNQTFVDALKQQGNFDDEAKVYAFTKAKDAALEIMSASTKKWLEKSVVDLDTWLMVQIEAAVKGAKQR